MKLYELSANIREVQALALDGITIQATERIEIK